MHPRVTPEAVNWHFIEGMVGWFLEVMLLKVSPLSIGGGDAPVLDIVSYAGYTFAAMCVAVFVCILLDCWLDVFVHRYLLGKYYEANSVS